MAGVKAGGAPPWRAATRVAFWGALAMAVTAGFGRLVGSVIQDWRNARGQQASQPLNQIAGGFAAREIAVRQDDVAPIFKDGDQGHEVMGRELEVLERPGPAQTISRETHGSGHKVQKGLFGDGFVGCSHGDVLLPQRRRAYAITSRIVVPAVTSRITRLQAPRRRSISPVDGDWRSCHRNDVCPCHFSSHLGSPSAKAA
jgi:hypothetical protein